MAKIEVNPPKFSCLDKVDPSQDQKKPSCPEEIEGQEEEVSSSKELKNTLGLVSGSKELKNSRGLVSSPKELNDTLNLARSFKTIRKDVKIAGQEVNKNLDTVLKRDLRRRLDSLVLIPNQDKELEIVKEPTRPIFTSTPSSSPTNPPPLPPRRCQSSIAPPRPPRTRSCSPSCSDVSSIQEEVFTDSEVSNPRKGREAIKSSNTRRRLASMVDPPGPSSQNCSIGSIIAAEPSIEAIATMNWKEAEKAVEESYRELQFSLKLYTPNDIVKTQP